MNASDEKAFELESGTYFPSEEQIVSKINQKIPQMLSAACAAHQMVRFYFSVAPLSLQAQTIAGFNCAMQPCPSQQWLLLG